MRVAYSLLFVAATAAVCLAFPGCSSKKVDLCEEHITWQQGTPKVSIPANDKLLICGDPNHAAWKDIPPNQSSYFLKNFLESKGYLSPEIKINYDTGHLTVAAGPQATVKSIIAKLPVPPDWKTSPLDTNIGKPMTKDTLDRIQQDAKGLLLENGYPCAKVDLKATPEGDIELDLNPGPALPFTDVRDFSTNPMRADVLSRYEPFEPGDQPFHMSKLTLAGRRLERDGIASSAIYHPHCKYGDNPDAPPTMQIARSLSFGPKRLWDFGVGASTEEYPILIGRWKNSRIWGSASQVEVKGYASNLRQTVGVDLKWFYSPKEPRVYLRPSFTFEHRNERVYETYETTSALGLGKMVDVGEWTLTPEPSLGLHRLHVVGDILNSRTDMYLSPGFTLNAHSNDYELYDNDPRAGINSQLDYGFISQHFGGEVTAHRVLLSGIGLYNWKSYTDPTWILAARFSFGSIFTSDGVPPDPNQLPPDWFFLLGGDQNLRGFGRNSIPPNSVGAGTMGYAGLESRWPSLIPLIQPLIFLDLAKIGSGNLSFSGPLFLSPGFGFRWGTPIGTLRMTLARGIALTTPTTYHWQFFISLGTEF